MNYDSNDQNYSFYFFFGFLVFSLSADSFLHCPFEQRVYD